MPRIAQVFGEMVRYYDVPEGSTINDFMIEKNPELKNFPVPTVAGTRKEGVLKPTSVEDVDLILRKDWDKPLVQNDIIVLVAVHRPQGGGGGSGNVFQMVLGVVMMVVGALLWWLGPVGYVSFAQGMVLTGAMLTLSGVVGMLNQPKLPSGATGNEEASPTYSLNGSTNQARLLQPIPEGFGRIQVTPDVVAQPYYTYENNDQYLYQVFGIGRGEYEINVMSFGEEIFWRDGSIDENSSLIGSSGEVSVEVVTPGNSVTLFPDNVESNTNVSRIQLFATTDPEFSGWMGPYVASPPGTHGEKFQIDFILSQGIGRYTDEGDLNVHSISITIQYQKIDDYGLALGPWQTDYFSISGATLTQLRRSKFVYADDGRYHFRFINNTAGSDDASRPYLDDIFVDGLRTYLPGSLKYTQSVIAIRIKATNLLSTNAQQQFRTVQTRILPIWNPDTRTWSEPVPTRRLDAALAAMCKAEWGGRLTDNRIDLDALAYIQSKCDEYEWNFDTFIDSSYTVWDLLVQSCLPYRTFPRLIGDKVSFMFDEKDRPIKHVFTPRDIQRGSLSPGWATHSDSTPDDIIVSYLDEDVAYAKREVQATLPGSRSREPKYLQYPVGVCSRKLAFDYAVYVAACNRYRRISLEFGVETMGRMLYVGDVVSVQHPRLRSAGFGKVVDWNGTDLLVYVDTMPTAHADGIDPANLWMAFNDPQGRPWGPVKLDSFENCVAAFNAEDYESVVQQQGNIFNWITAGYQSQPTVWVLQTGKNINRRFLIQNIKFQDMQHATLSVMNDDPRVHEQDIPMPPWEYRQNNVMWTALTPPQDFTIVYRKSAGVVALSWTPVVGAFSYELEFGPSMELLQPIYGIINNTIDISIERFTYGRAHFFRLRSADNSSFSKWVTVTAVIGD